MALGRVLKSRCRDSFDLLCRIVDFGAILWHESCRMLPFCRFYIQGLIESFETASNEPDIAKIPFCPVGWESLMLYTLEKTKII